MAPLNEGLRRELSKRVVDAREVAEQGAGAALARLAVADKEPHGHLNPDERVLRNRLRARARALGDTLRPNGVQELDRLVEEVAYEAWHRMLFARFLAENGLLMHPEHGVPVTLAECEELAKEEGAEDQWVLASRYAARMLPQIFRPDDPALQVVFAPEHRTGLERLLEALAPEVFRADDSLGWVYQFWQAKKKDEVNAAGEPITGETLPAVTQLFTEPYMVSFLLENTIGAWWAGRNPGETLPVEMSYLRRLEDGTPAAGTFEGWPKTWREFTLLDPCCGSGHFLVAALRLVVPLRMYDEGLDAASAVDAVLRENLHGLELDARCTQIAAFAVALAGWTTPGAMGYRPLPELQIACSGLAVTAKRAEWVTLAEGDERIGAALGRMHDLFKLAPELGSLIDPSQGRADLLMASFDEVQPLLARALASEQIKRDVEREAAAVTAQGVARAAGLLASRFTVVATNVPYLGVKKQGPVLRDFCEQAYPEGKEDLATVFLLRCLAFCRDGGVVTSVAPQNWLVQHRYRHLRKLLLTNETIRLIAVLGERAFDSDQAAGAFVALSLIQRSDKSTLMQFIDVSGVQGSREKAFSLVQALSVSLRQSDQLDNPDSRIVAGDRTTLPLLAEFAFAPQGIKTGDDDRFRRCHWELEAPFGSWERYQSTVLDHVEYGGRQYLVDWATKGMEMIRPRLGSPALGRMGVAVSQMRDLPATIYCGDRFDSNVAPIVPLDQKLLPALWAFCTSKEFVEEVRRIERKVSVTNASFLKIPFDKKRWTTIADEQWPVGLRAPESSDPTQWLFSGRVPEATDSLQVAVARLVGYRWPEQSADEHFEKLLDLDGVVCLPAVRGESPAFERLQALLAVAYGQQWSPAVRDALLSQVGYGDKSLELWLREIFFAQHCALFHHRPFIWHIWDGLKDGFSALVNYHKLNRATLETLTYTYLGDWIARQEEARKRDERGADVRLAKAKELQQKLQLIIEGEPPYDLFLRWKAPHEQPIGWDPDLNDGVRVNIWPFVQAGVLRSKVNVNWKKDRGKNPPGSPWGEERYNRYEDIPRAHRPASLRDVDHLTNEVRRRLREEAAVESNGGSNKGAKAVRR